MTAECGWCHREFAVPPGTGKRYCNPGHRRAASRKRAHQRAVRLQMCLTYPKPEYPDEAAALAAAAWLRRVPPLYPYECHGHWHLSQQPPADRAAGEAG